MSIQERIEQYVEHLQDLAYIDALLQSVKSKELFDTITDMLGSGNQEEVWATDLLIRDIVLMAKSEAAQLFRNNLPGSQVVNALNKNVLAPNYFVRHDTVYTIGKIILSSSLSVLLNAFRYSIENDPLSLPGLVFELGWLGHVGQWKLIEEMTHSSHYLTRWATLATYLFDGFKRPRNKRETVYIEQQSRTLDLLRKDNSLLVRAEAEYKYQELSLTLNARRLSKVGQKKMTETLNLYTPALTFETVSIHFQNYLGENNKNDYAVSELDVFVSAASQNLLQSSSN